MPLKDNFYALVFYRDFEGGPLDGAGFPKDIIEVKTGIVISQKPYLSGTNTPPPNMLGWDVFQLEEWELKDNSVLNFISKPLEWM